MLPHNLLPAPEPRKATYPADYFYENVAKHLIVDVVRIMDNGLHIDLDKVADLEVVLDEQLAKVQVDLANNPYVDQLNTQLNETYLAKYIKDRQSKLRTSEYYLKPFKANDQVHRSYFMYLYAQQQNLTQPTELLPTDVPKWPANTVKKLATTRPLLRKLLNKELTEAHPIAAKAMQLLAEHKADMYNTKYVNQINNPDLDLQTFNPGSSKQKQQLFALIGIQSETMSKKTGLPSFDKKEIERIHNETLDEDVKQLTHTLMEYSTAAIIRNNFIEAFYKFTVDDYLYGSLKLFGAKSFRLTSSQPNMLNMPSTGSVFAKPTKKCFTAPEGFLVATIDYSALEDRVIASLSRDKNKCDLFLQNLDGHCLNAYGYFKDEIAQHMELTNDTTTDVKKFFELTHTSPELKAIRQKGKPATFGLSYGSFPKKVSQTLKIPLDEAEQIFNNYHEVLYPGITEYRETYVLPTAQSQGYIHLGLGCIINTDDADRDIRTLNNATAQFWSILTLLTINKLHRLIDEAGLQEDIKVTATIYDSIYLQVSEDPEVVEWLNNTIVPIMETDFMENQTVRNEARLEIGLDWANLTELSDTASLEDITTTMESLYA